MLNLISAAAKLKSALIEWAGWTVDTPNAVWAQPPWIPQALLEPVYQL